MSKGGVMDKILFTPETEVYIMNMHNPNKPLHGYIRDVITMTEYDTGCTTYQYDVRVDNDDTDLNIVNKRVSLTYILYAKCSGNWYVVNDLIKVAETHYNNDKSIVLGKYLTLDYAPCVKDMMYELEHNNVDCEMHNRVYCIKEEKIMIADNLDQGTKIIYYIPDSLQTFIGYINHKSYKGAAKDLYYLVSGDYGAESISIKPEQILGYECSDVWIDIATCLPTRVYDIVNNFDRRFGTTNYVYDRAANHDHKDSVDSLRYAYTSGKGEKYGHKRYKSYYEVPTYDLSASYNKKKIPTPSEQLKKKLKRIEVNGEYMTAVWYDRPATVIKLSENDMYDTEKAYMWLLLKGLCDNNKSECDRILKLMESITYDIEKRRSNETDANTGRD
jgi:hypothetical protein